MWHKAMSFLPRVSNYIKVSIACFIWVVFISWLHVSLNSEHETRDVIRMGYMPVVTNFAVPILDYASLEGDGIRYKALKFASFAEMAESLRNGQIDAAFMIAPLSIVLRQQGEDVKVVYIGNRHESTMVTRKDLHVETLYDLVGKTIGVPMRYSGHNLSLLKMIEENNLTGQINIVEMNPPDMAAAVTTGALDGYYVGEPFAAQTLVSGHADKFLYAEDVWENFICNLMVVRSDFIEQRPEVVQELITGTIRSGLWADENQEQAIEIAAKYWNQKVELIEYALNTPFKRTVFDRYIPKQNEIQEIADLMKEHDLVDTTVTSGLIDDTFALSANVEEITTIESILP